MVYLIVRRTAYVCKAFISDRSSALNSYIPVARVESRAGTICRIFRYSNIRILHLLNYLANIIRISEYSNAIRIFKYSNTDVFK